MKKAATFKQCIAILLLVMLFSVSGLVLPEDVRAEETAFNGQDFLTSIKGNYIPLFEGATFNEEYNHYWRDYAAAVAGESQADSMVSYLKSSIGATGYGKDAVPPNFYCGFIDNIKSIRFAEDGKMVTFARNDGSEVTHEYEYVKEAAATGTYEGYGEIAMNGHLYKAVDDNDDICEYLLMFPDTPDTTYHLEFRFADTEENVLSLTSGDYGYWVGSAICETALTETNEATLQNVISLFVVENLAAMTSEETANQRAGLVGTWDCDFSAMPEYANAKMYIILGADGSGKTYADFTGKGTPALTAEYTFFAYDNNKTDGKDAGTYISLNEKAETVTPGNYEVGTVNGKKALIFTSAEGTIAYLYRESAPAPATEPAPAPAPEPAPAPVPAQAPSKIQKTQKITVKTASKTYKAKSLKKKGKSFNIGAKAKTELSYKVTKYPKKAKKYITVSKKGKVTLKKKAKKGTYKILVTAKKSGEYKKATRTIIIKVK